MKRNRYVEMTFKGLQESLVVKGILRLYKYQTHVIQRNGGNLYEVEIYTTKPVTDLQWLKQWKWLRSFAGRYNALSMVER